MEPSSIGCWNEYVVLNKYSGTKRGLESSLESGIGWGREGGFSGYFEKYAENYGMSLRDFNEGET